MKILLPLLALGCIMFCRSSLTTMERPATADSEVFRGEWTWGSATITHNNWWLDPSRAGDWKRGKPFFRSTVGDSLWTADEMLQTCDIERIIIDSLSR